jgi:hypothetical protein
VIFAFFVLQVAQPSIRISVSEGMQKDNEGFEKIKILGKLRFSEGSNMYYILVLDLILGPIKTSIEKYDLIADWLIA